VSVPVRTIAPSDIVDEAKIPIAALGRDRFPYVDLDPSEQEAVLTVLRRGLEHLKMVSPEVYSAVVLPTPGANLEQLVLRFAGIAKAQFPTLKPYTFPSTGGKLGVAWLFPQAIKYSATVPTSYTSNSWDIPITAGTNAYLLGSSTSHYITSKNPYTAILVLYNGLVEFGTTPSAQQFRLISVSKGDYGIYSVEPLVDVPVAPNKTIYIYPTPMGALFIDHQFGVTWYFMPSRTGTATIKMLGLVFYEHEFLSDTKWIT
jgi:hypothetical protein